MRNKEVNARGRIFFTNFDQARLDDVHRNAGRTFAHDDLSRRKLGSLQTTAQFCKAIGAKFGEQLDVLQELNKLVGIVNYRGHLLLFVSMPAFPGALSEDESRLSLASGTWEVKGGNR